RRGTSTLTSISVAVACVVMTASRGSSTFLCMEYPSIELMNKQQGYEDRDQQTKTGDRPGRRSAACLPVQQQQPGQREQHGYTGEDVDEPAPCGTGVTSLVQVIGVGNPATIGAFVEYLTGMQIDRQPGVAAWARQP